MRHIIDLARGIAQRYGGKNIFETAENWGVKVWYRRLGGLKGFYVFENNNRYIVINNALDSMMKRVVCAHEMGHDALHRDLAAGGIRESTMFLDTNKTEREANLFAAEILIPNKQILSELRYCDSIETLAYELDLPRELVEYKLEILNFEGFSFNVNAANSDFLKDY